MAPLRYEVGLTRRRHHLVDVVVTVPAELAAGARLVVPTWTPGSYVERNYVHHLQARRATTSDGVEVPLTADGHTAFRLPEDVDGDVRVELEWYANELTVRTNHVDDHHALLVPPATFPYVEGAEDRPCEVHVTPTPGHEVHGLLPRRAEDAPGATAVFAAEDYLHLVDSAFEVGDLPTIEFSVEGVPHRWVQASHGGPTPDLDRIASEVTAISAAARTVVGTDLPVASYTFLCVGAEADAGGGGLEHRDGSVLMLPVLSGATAKGRRRARSLIAHEYFHLWNVKRLVPAELLELTFDRPQHTTNLWVAEGWTAHYDDLLPARAGLHEVRHYLDALRDNLVWVERTPGARRQSVAEASWHAWTGLYVRDENSVNAGTNYYTHGALLAACLDLLIRQEAPGGDGLDEAFRLLWQRFGHEQATGYPRTGYTHDDVVAALSDAAGRDLAGFVDDHVRGLEPPPLADLLEVAGLRLDRTEPDDARPDIGVQTVTTQGQVVFEAVLRDRPAWRAGLTGGDRLVAVDDVLVGPDELDQVLASTEPGQTVEVTVARGSRLLRFPVELAPPLPDVEVVPVSDPTDEQADVFARWTGRDLASAASDD